MGKFKLEKIAEQAIAFARSEINEFGLPHPIAFDLSLDKGRWLANEMNARQDLVDIGIALMDVKLGQAFNEKRLSEHISMSMSAGKEFLAKHTISEEEKIIILNAIEGHHGGVPFKTLESEICANADCYRFIHPKGFFLYLTILGQRSKDFTSCLDQAEAKMDEKMKMVSLPIVKDELEPIYRTLKEYIALARE
jgi:hypothetical protein